MTSLGNVLLAFAALGAGLVYTAVGAGSAPVSAVVLVAIGLLAMAWAVLVLARDRVPASRVSLGAAVGAILAWVVLAALGGIVPEAVGGLPLVPLLASSVMLLYVAIVLAIRFRAEQQQSAQTDASDHRHPEATRSPARRTSAGRFLLGVTAGGFIVAALTTPALALTNAGEHAVPHGTHGFSEHAGH